MFVPISDPRKLSDLSKVPQVINSRAETWPSLVFCPTPKPTLLTTTPYFLRVWPFWVQIPLLAVDFEKTIYCLKSVSLVTHLARYLFSHFYLEKSYPSFKVQLLERLGLPISICLPAMMTPLPTPTTGLFA